MCGRFVLTDFDKKIFSYFKLSNSKESIKPRYNIYPTDIIPVVLKNNGFRCLEFVQWGLIPFWSKTKKPLINARIESVTKKPSFFKAVRKRRCLVPASGFYEWKREKKLKQPYFICLRNTKLFAFAGIWEDWITNKGEKIKTCAILTTEPNSFMANIHKRMPVILNHKNFEMWLDSPEFILKNSFSICTSHSMIAWKVTKKVGNPNFDNPNCLKKLSENKKYLEGEKTEIQGSFFD